MYEVKILTIIAFVAFVACREGDDVVHNTVELKPPPIWQCCAVSAKGHDGYCISPYKEVAERGALKACADNTGLYYKDASDVCMIEWCRP